MSGREFFIYREYDEQVQMHYLTYPDFMEHPEYTGEGRPFCLTVQESCEHGRCDNDPNVHDPGDCGGCEYFYREKTAYDAIGVCMCEARRRELTMDN